MKQHADKEQFLSDWVKAGILAEEIYNDFHRNIKILQ
jgi:hypothetical protein